jgi:hypothetical protein
MKFSSTSTAAAGSTQKLFQLALSGANATSSQTTYAGYFTNTHTGTGAVNYGLYSSATGTTTNYGVYGVGTWRGVYGTATSGSGVEGSGTTTGTGVLGTSVSGSAVYGNSSSGYALQGITATGSSVMQLTANPTTTNTVVPIIQTQRAVSSGVGANGIGGSIEMYTETSDGNAYLSNSITSKLSDATTATRTSDLTLKGVYSGSTTTYAVMGGTSLGRAGEIQLPGYANTNDDGFATNVIGTSTDGTLTSTPVRKIYTNSVSANSTITLSASGFYVNTSGTPTWSVPTVAAGVTGVVYWIKNRSSGSLTINVVGGASTIYDTSAVSSITVLAGGSAMLECDGTYWNKL